MKYVLSMYIVLSFVTLLVYGVDKRAAARGRRRIAESRLHLLALLGGVPGALLGQQVFRHKRRKWRFVLLTWAILLLHAAAWIGWWQIR